MTALYETANAVEAPPIDHEPPQRLRYIVPSPRDASQGRFHTQFVRVAKFLLPLCAVVLLGLAFLWPNLHDRLEPFTSFVPVAINAATEDYEVLRMTIEGLNENDQPYVFSAETAIKFDTDIDEIDLTRPTADLTREDGTWVALMAENGMYLKAENRLMMRDNVNVFHDTDYEFNTDLMWIDLDTGEATGDGRIIGHGEFGEIIGDGGYRFAEDGKAILFKGPVKITIYPGMETKPVAETGQ